ncbi:hypothetical protein ABEW34_21460 [Paenibacillus algorifonticola]|uniref:hypothetical protein n=1 Tax=Paenibacillus algorifonticola TaxID=684063 RepID=UPI003D2A371B
MRKILIVGVILACCSGCGLFLENQQASSSENENNVKFTTERLGGPRGWVLTDIETGCQYIAQNNDVAYTPRLTADGIPMCANTK